MLGEQITANGVGNDLFRRSRCDSKCCKSNLFTTIPKCWRSAIYAHNKIVLIGLVILAIVVGVIYIQQAVRKIPIQYAKAVSGNNQYQEQNTHLPLKVNSAGVIPVILLLHF